MLCDDFLRMLDNYENLTDDEKSLIADHAAECESCRRELDFMRSIINAVKTLPEIPVPDDFLDKLNERIDAEFAAVEKKSVKRGGFIQHIQHNWQKYSAVAACMVLAAVIGTNYDMLIDNMNGSDNGVITEISAVSTAVPENPTADGAKTDIAKASGNAEENSTDVSTANEDNGTGTSAPDRQTAGERPVSGAASGGFVSSGARKSTTASDAAVSGERQSSASSGGYTSPVIENQPSNETVNENTGTSPETTPETTEGNSAETFTLPRSVYVETPAGPVVSSAPDEGSSYEINAAEDGTYAAVTEPATAAPVSAVSEPEDDGPGYTLNPNNVIVVAETDYTAAVRIISRYLAGSYGSYYVVRIEDIDRMLMALDAADIDYVDFVSTDVDDITFRILVD